MSSYSSIPLIGGRIELIMLSLFVAAPLVALIVSFLLYRQTGKRELLKFDIVQLLYAFVIAPLMFIWLKSFLYYILTVESSFAPTPANLFLIDTSFSVVFLFIYAFIVIHWVTKSFEVKRYKDPFYDMLSHSETLHLWVSHTFMFLGILVLLLMLAIANIFFPLEVEASRLQFYFILALGYLAGWIGFAGVWLANFTESKFLLLMRFCFAIYFLILALSYFVSGLKFSSDYGVFWFLFMSGLGLTSGSFLLEKSNKVTRFVNTFTHKHKEGWQKGNFLTLLSVEHKRNQSK